MRYSKTSVFAIVILFCLSFFSSILAITPAETLWAKTGGNPDFSMFRGVVTDSDKNLYAVGLIFGTDPYDFGNGVIATAAGSGNNAILVKYDQSGKAQWAKTTVAASSQSVSKDIAIDSSGNLYVVGYIEGTGSYDFGNGVTVSGGDSLFNIFLVKYDKNGTAQWARSTTTASDRSYSDSIILDSSSNIYIGGYINGSGSFSFGNGVTVSGAYIGSNAVLVKYDTNGNAQWAKSTDVASGSSSFTELALDGGGNIYTSGYIKDTNLFDFGNGTVATGTSSDYNAVLVKYSSTGSPLVAKSTEVGINSSSFFALTFDNIDSLYVGGYIASGAFDFGNETQVNITGTATRNAVLVKYSTDIVPQWVKSDTTNSTNSQINSVAMKDGVDLYAVGYIKGPGTHDFGDGVVVNGTYSDQNVVVLGYNSTGITKWGKSVIGSHKSEFNKLAIDNNGNLDITGHLVGIDGYDFGDGVVVNGTYAGTSYLLVKYLTGSLDPSSSSSKKSSFSSSSSNGNVASDAASIKLKLLILGPIALFTFL